MVILVPRLQKKGYQTHAFFRETIISKTLPTGREVHGNFKVELIPIAQRIGINEFKTKLLAARKKKFSFDTSTVLL